MFTVGGTITWRAEHMITATPTHRRANGQTTAEPPRYCSQVLETFVVAAKHFKTF